MRDFGSFGRVRGRSGFGSAAFAAVLMACAVAPATAPAHGTLAIDGGGDRVPRAVEQVLGGDVRLLPDGLYRVRSSVGTFTTHGPDFRREIQPIGGIGSRFGPGDPRAAARLCQ